MTKEIVMTLSIKRDSSFLWVLGTNEQGYLTVLKVTKGKRGRPPKKPLQALQTPAKVIEQEDNKSIESKHEENEINWDE